MAAGASLQCLRDCAVAIPKHLFGGGSKMYRSRYLAAVVFAAATLPGCQKIQSACIADPIVRVEPVALVESESLPLQASLRGKIDEKVVARAKKQATRSLLVTMRHVTQSAIEDCVIKIHKQSLLLTGIGAGAEVISLGTIEVAYQREDDGGFSSLDTFSLEQDVHSDWPLVTLTQTSLPVPGDRVFRPGPPTTRTYCFRDGAYRYSEQCRKH